MIYCNSAKNALDQLKLIIELHVHSGGSWLSLMVGQAKQLLKCQSSIRRLPKFKGGVNKF